MDAERPQNGTVTLFVNRGLIIELANCRYSIKVFNISSCSF